ncbi:MAG: acetyltransferase [Flavobacteriaceae bacterium]|nr:acetyltransferase [Flavobacteriaceae bacterium]|tara:strand:+ start:742 stop:1023 length:282 start_codon:yes stop_codon:yes gene_type:complete
MANRNTLVQHYFSNAKALKRTYPDLVWDEYYYLTIALDNALGGRWDNIIDKPAYKHLSFTQLVKVVTLLEQYKKDKAKLLADRKTSLEYREFT